MLKLLVNKPKRLIGLALLLSLTVSVAAMLSLHEMRVDAFERAKDAGANIALVIEHDITRNLEFYSLSLQNVADRLADPEVLRLSEHVQRMVLFDGRIQAQDLGAMLVTDREGHVILDSKVAPPRKLNFSDRDYFLRQAENDNMGVYISKPFEARTGLGLAIALSLRLNDADGKFAGVVSGGLRVRYFDRLFSGVTLGKNGSIALLYADGTLATRRPALESAAAAAKRSVHLGLFANTTGGTYLDASVRDGVERLYTYRRIGNYPLFVAVGTATDDIYDNWKARAWWIGVLVVLFNVVTLAMAYLFAQHLERRIEEQRRHAELAATDALTVLANRRALDERLEAEWRRAARERQPLSVLMIDVDHFKAYNDQYGHPDGDVALQAVARCIQANLRRPGDLAARYGGEEFCVVLPGSDLGSANVVAETIRHAIQALDIPHARSDAAVLTVSIGAASGTPAAAGELRTATLTKAADAQLYRAKTSGRNRTVA